MSEERLMEAVAAALSVVSLISLVMLIALLVIDIPPFGYFFAGFVALVAAFYWGLRD